MFRRTHALPVGMALLTAGALAAGCSGGGSASSAGSGNGAPVTIKAVLPPNTGPITAADNAGLKAIFFNEFLPAYQKAHPNITDGNTVLNGGGSPTGPSGPPFLGSTGAIKLNKPVVGMTLSQGGYYLGASDGGIFTFPPGGVPPFLGSRGGQPLNAPIVGISG